MCGIVGSVNFKLKYEEADAVMLHRGPDEQNGFRSENVDLYHLRLAILDVDGGQQPMHIADRYTIVFNGEIYNHQELRQKFALQGTSHSDTETLLLLYQKMGPAFLDELDGMFAFAIYDQQQNELFIARDRAGKKPLFIYNDGKKIVFASELNCLNRLLPLEINPDHFYSYTRLGSFYRGFTPYKQVTELLGGSFIQLNCKTLQIKETRWWNIHSMYKQKRKTSFEESLQQTDDYLELAIKRRLESSDLEVGCFLSGGIDSGLVTAIASKYKPNLKTFTVSFSGEYDEAPLAREVAAKYETDHTELKISFSNLYNDVENIIANYGEPFFDDSAIPSFYVCREASRYLTVILNGDGADELFGGYRRYMPFAHYDFFKQNPLVKIPAALLQRFLPPGHEKKSSYNYLYRLAGLASKSGVESYLTASVDIMEGYESFLLPGTSNDMKQLEQDFEQINNSSLSGLRKIMNMDFDTNLFSDLLVKMDIASMANSLEGRSPFLSKELLEYAPSLPDNFKIRGGSTKYLLRQLAKKYLPPILIEQPKRGFEVPLKNWIEHELKDMVHDYVGVSGNFSCQFIDQTFIQQLLEKKVRISDEKRAKILWMIFCMEVWHKKSYKQQ
ncbi:MAG: hypothetical protein JWQ27_2539 [Ferruginibacter sp.]|nr:hypothetical protein [Ferruginibacter sp.]